MPSQLHEMHQLSLAHHRLEMRQLPVLFFCLRYNEHNKKITLNWVSSFRKRDQ